MTAATPDRRVYDVRIWRVRSNRGQNGTTYTVRWRVGRRAHQRTFATGKLGESFRSGLIVASHKVNRSTSEPAYPTRWCPGRSRSRGTDTRARSSTSNGLPRRRGIERGSPRVSSLARLRRPAGFRALQPSICSDGRCFGGPSTPALGDDCRSTRPSALRSSRRPFGGLTTTRQRSTSSPGPRFCVPCSTHSPSDSTGHRHPRRPSPASGPPSTAPWPTRSNWSFSQPTPWTASTVRAYSTPTL